MQNHDNYRIPAYKYQLLLLNNAFVLLKLKIYSVIEIVMPTLGETLCCQET